MNKNNQSGIAHLALILVVLLVAGTGFAGWRVFEASKDKKQTQVTSQETSQSTASTVDETSTSTYINKDLGLSFKYPKNWGDATIRDGEIVSPGKGSYKQVVFSKLKEIDINFVQAGFSSPLDGCPDPIWSETHNLAAKRASTIGWDSTNLKFYELDWERLPETNYKVRLSASVGESGTGWDSLSSQSNVLEYKDKTPYQYKTGDIGDGGNCQNTTQAVADEANAYSKYIRYAVNFSTNTIVGVNAQYDARKADNPEIRKDLVKVLLSITK